MINREKEGTYATLREKKDCARIVSINGNNLLTTIFGDIIEEKKYLSSHLARG